MKYKRGLQTPMNKTYDVYIAGSMTGRKIGTVLLERAEAKALLSAYGLTYYDPADGEGLEAHTDMNDVISNAFDFPKMESYVKKDLNAVAHSRAVLNITGDLPSEGSTWEMAFAIYHRFIPVHLVAPQRVTQAKMTFTNVLVDGLHETLQEAVFALSEELKREKV